MVSSASATGRAPPMARVVEDLAHMFNAIAGHDPKDPTSSDMPVVDYTSALRADPVRSRQIGERIPAGRWGEPEDLGGAVVFLSSRASDYVNGHVLVVDGGWLGR